MKTLSLLAHPDTGAGAVREQRIAITLSLAIGFLMLGGKMYAYLITGSAAILSDAAESVVHVFAVTFAAFSLFYSQRPPDKLHPYGHEKIGFFSAGMEGFLIIVAAVYIIYEAVSKWISGLFIENISTGTLFVAGAALINAGLGGYLIWQGKRHGSLILVANGKHVLTDSWTSLGVIIGLLLVLWTGWLPFDPILAILVAANILWSGAKLIRQSVGGLMDEGDPDLETLILETLNAEVEKRGVRYHELRYRYSGTSIWVEFHLLFNGSTPIEDAHEIACEIEAAVKKILPVPVNIISHLEPVERHDEAHERHAL